MKKSRGFTVVELLIVIAIISLISSVIVVSVRGSREGAIIARKVQQSTVFHKMLGMGLVGEWRMNGGEPGESWGGPLEDSSGNGNHLYSSGGGFFGDFVMEESFHQEFGNALFCSGSLFNFQSTVPAENALNLGGEDLSIAVWIRIESSDSTGDVFRANFGSETIYALHFNSSNRSINMSVGNQSCRTEIEENEWHFVLGTYEHKGGSFGEMDGYGTLSIYVDGEKKVESDISGILWFKSVYEGEDGALSGCNFSNGLMDDLRVYSEAMKESQVQTMYAEEAKERGLVKRG